MVETGFRVGQFLHFLQFLHPPCRVETFSSSQRSDSLVTNVSDDGHRRRGAEPTFHFLTSPIHLVFGEMGKGLIVSDMDDEGPLVGRKCISEVRDVILVRLDEDQRPCLVG